MHSDYEKLKQITSFNALIEYLKDELDWPIDVTDAEDITFDYHPEELGLNEEHKVKIREIKQIRPLVTNQPWGIFYIDFEPKRLPVVVMRRILRALIPKKRASSRQTDHAVWNLNDLLFIRRKTI